MKNPFPISNYPPGVSHFTPDAPWNEKDIVGLCYECDTSKYIEDMTAEEAQSLDDNGDGFFLCDKCWTPEDGDS